MPFSNPIVAGTDLVRSAIKSPNYVPSVSGWQVSVDGTAEFTDINVRGVITVEGPDGRYIRLYLDPGTLIPVLDFQPVAPTTPGWTVSAASMFEYQDTGYEVLGIGSPQQMQPAATGGEATVSLRSGKAADPNTAITLTATNINIVGSLGHGPTGLTFPLMQRGATSCTTPGTASTATFAVTFPTAFPPAATVQVCCNINTGVGTTSRCRVRAISITTTGFTLFAESNDTATNLTWTAVSVGWIAVATGY